MSVGWITVTETIAALKVLEPRQTVSRDQLHYWDRLGVVPVQRAKDGRAPLYSTQDLALCRVIVRLLAAGAVPQQVTAALRYLRRPICDGLRDKDSRVLYLDARGMGAVVAASKVPADAMWQVDLGDCWRGVSRAMRDELHKRPAQLWDGRRHAKRRDLVAA